MPVRFAEEVTCPWSSVKPVVQAPPPEGFILYPAVQATVNDQRSTEPALVLLGHKSAMAVDLQNHSGFPNGTTGINAAESRHESSHPSATRCWAPPRIVLCVPRALMAPPPVRVPGRVRHPVALPCAVSFHRQ